ncbi:exonuclease SbcC [Nocardioides sp. BE266]|uniref:SMC family ATPase n=1 Tax=Nocardioides sp. BE266 TaxID=2817725 RepID=UPI0028565AFB|nr:SMC family ATPase [Nocardioides sp. BE266]MDR7254341.1 exonuclease SbcC [Nocardioides sp. BE266]
MRLHHLEVTGFGPFADRVRIDFDTLSDAGLFLLSGPTGAGKSSVLDAVCFALYGDVPGDRATAKRLRSDHAGDDVVPRVVLEATLSGRRFRIDRSPAWTRLKKRGTGRTTEQARVVISERRPSAEGDDAFEWHPLSTRLDETGHLVTRLVGMTLPQFCQVALLPQGRFQAFLRARSEERHTLLQQVFQTERFDRVERWLRDRRVELRRTSETHQAALADLVSRVSEVGAAEPPDDWAADPVLLTPWIEQLAAGTTASATAQEIQVAAAESAEAAAGEASTAGHELASLRAAHASALRAASALEAEHVAHLARQDQASAAQRALAVRPLHQVAIAARRAEEQAAADFQQVRLALAELVGEGDLDDHQVADHLRSATATLTDVARIRPLQQEVDALSVELDGLAASRDEARSALARLAARAEELPARLAALAPQLEEATAAVARAASLEADVQLVDTRIAAARAAERLTTELAGAEQALREATEARLEAREVLVVIRERRLDGMAAEIAGKLAVGACCPVCGSADHPSLAAPAPGAPDEVAEREARRGVDDLEAVVEAHAQQVRGLVARQAAALAEAGDTVERLAASRSDLTAALDEARRDAGSVDSLAARRTALADELDVLVGERDDLTAAATRLDTDAAVLASRLDGLRDQVAAVLPDGTDLDSFTAGLQAIEALATRCLDATAHLERARAEAERADSTAETSAVDAGFESADDASAAWLSTSDLAALRHLIEQHDRDVARIDEQLADPDLVRAASAEPPDLERLARDLHRAREEATAARALEARLHDRRRRLDGLADEIRSALAAWLPVRSDLDLVADLAAMVEGKHPDNHLQMRLSAYVLAHRLGQVVDAANLRLSTMSDQRYSLVHTGRRGAGETRGGLSLLVRDDWTGDSRDPATLSGGETFVVSLALALGLADVITDEAGGADLDTLFVDEGFGSLDAETLEDVMDTLDTLRDGGRVVGVVSHVPELQTRIPTQLRVHRGRHGSRTSLQTA